MSYTNSSGCAWLAWIRRFFLHLPESYDEFFNTVTVAKDRALIDHDSFRMIEGVLALTHMTADDVMLPRPQMDILDVDMSISDALSFVIKSAHSRFPVFDTADNKVAGILLAKDLLQLLHEDSHQKNLKDLLRPAFLIPESKRLNTLLREFRLKHNHMAIVIDEYGNIEGLITIEDVLEKIVGNILDEHDADENPADYIKQIEVNIAEVEAITPIQYFNHYFDKHFESDQYDTIGGLILQKLSHLPKEGETIAIDDLEMTVLKATDRGIQKLRVYRNL